MSLAKKGTAVFLANWLMFPLRLVTNILVVRTVGAEGKGILVILTTGAGLLAVIGALGLHAAATFHVRKGTFTERTVLASFLPFVLITTLLAIACSSFEPGRKLLTLFFGETSLAPSLLALAIALLPLTMLANFMSGLLLGKGWAKDYAMLTGLNGVLVFVLTGVLVFGLRLGLFGAMLAVVLAQALALAFTLSGLIRKTAGQAWTVRRQAMAGMLKFGLQHYLKSVGALAFKRADSFLLAYFLDLKAVGYYSIASVAYESVLSIPKAINGLLGGEAAARSEKSAAKIVAQASRVLFAVMLIVAAGGAVLTPWVLPWLFGADFVRSVWPTITLLAASVVFGFTVSVEPYFLGVNRPAFSGLVMLGAGVINIGLSVLLIPRYGLVGNAMATLLAAAIGAWLHIYWFRRFSGCSWSDVILVKGDELRPLLEKYRSRFPKSRATPVMKS